MLGIRGAMGRNDEQESGGAHDFPPTPHDAHT
jgi:hypothetical protein